MGRQCFGSGFQRGSNYSTQYEGLFNLYVPNFPKSTWELFVGLFCFLFLNVFTMALPARQSHGFEPTPLNNWLTSKSPRKKVNVKKWTFLLKIWVIIAPLVIWITFFKQFVVLGLFFNYYSFCLRKKKMQKIDIDDNFFLSFYVLGLLRNTGHNIGIYLPNFLYTACFFHKKCSISSNLSIFTFLP